MDPNERLDRQINRRKFVGKLLVAGAAAAGLAGTAAIGAGIGIGMSEGETDQPTDDTPGAEVAIVPGTILGGTAVDMTSALIALKGVAMIYEANKETPAETIADSPTVIFRNQQTT